MDRLHDWLPPRLLKHVLFVFMRTVMSVYFLSINRQLLITYWIMKLWECQQVEHKYDINVYGAPKFHVLLGFGFYLTSEQRVAGTGNDFFSVCVTQRRKAEQRGLCLLKGSIGLFIASTDKWSGIHCENIEFIWWFIIMWSHRLTFYIHLLYQPKSFSSFNE